MGELVGHKDLTRRRIQARRTIAETMPADKPLERDTGRRPADKLTVVLPVPLNGDERAQFGALTRLPGLAAPRRFDDPKTPTRLRNAVWPEGRPALAGLVAGSQGLAETPGAVSVSVGGEPDHAPGLKRYLELTSSRGAHTVDGDIALGDERRDKVRVEGEIGYGDLVDLKLQADFADLYQLGDRKVGEVAFVKTKADGWQKNTVSEVKADLGLLDGRLRFTSRRAASRYSASESYLKNLKGEKNKGKKRFLGNEGAEGAAVLHRIGATVWKAEEAEVSAFAQYSEVGPFFESVELSGKRKHGGLADKNDPFATPNEEALRFGTTVGLGPMQLTLQRHVVQKVERADGERELRRGASVWIDLNDLRYRVGDAFQGGLWAWVPDSAWVSITEGSVEAPSDHDDPDDATSDISFGASWDWDGAYASASFWQSRYDSRGFWVDDYDWEGRGADIALGLYGGNWAVDASFGYTRSEDLAAPSRSADYGYDGSLSATLRPEHFPDLSGAVSLGHYGTDYIAYGKTSRTEAWGLDVTADFSKYLADPETTNQPRLKVGYRFEGDHMRDGFTGESGRADHTIAAQLQLNF